MHCAAAGGETVMGVHSKHGKRSYFDSRLMTFLNCALVRVNH